MRGECEGPSRSIKTSVCIRHRLLNGGNSCIPHHGLMQRKLNGIQTPFKGKASHAAQQATPVWLARAAWMALHP